MKSETLCIKTHILEKKEDTSYIVWKMMRMKSETLSLEFGIWTMVEDGDLE